MALTLEQEKALLALLQEKRTTLPELSATAELTGSDLFLTSQMLADKSVTADVMKQFIAPDATLSRKGTVQLSNQINSDSETQAATSKAIKQAYEQTHSQLAESVISKHINATESMKIRSRNAVTAVAGVGAESDGNIRLVPANIGALSENEADNHYLRLENAPDFVILYPNGTPDKPYELNFNTRIIVENPFAGHNVLYIPEVYINNMWANPFFIYGQGEGNQAYGVRAAQTSDDVIIIQSGNKSIHTAHSSQMGNAFGYSGAYINSALLRLKVFKIK